MNQYPLNVSLSRLLTHTLTAAIAASVVSYPVIVDGPSLSNDGMIQKANSSKSIQVSFFGKSSAKSLLKYAGSWRGNDLKDCLAILRKHKAEIEL